MTIQLDDLGALVGVLVGIATLAWRNRGVTAISGTDHANLRTTSRWAAGPCGG